MITKEQFVYKLLKYIDCEIMPVMSTVGKWGIGTFVMLAKTRSEIIMNEILVNPMIKSLGIVNSDGLINCDLLLTALYDSAQRYGKLTVSIPIIGTLAFTHDDVIKLKSYMLSEDKI